MASRPGTSTKPERLAASTKRARQNALYAELLPVIPTPNEQHSSSYLTRFLSSLSPSTTRTTLDADKIHALYDDLTRSIWVQSERDMQLLWRRGFFGKATLSRSEPAWKRRVQNKIAALSDTANQGQTAEEVTAQRRKERLVYKHQKRAEREAEKLAAANQAVEEGRIVIDSPLPPLTADDLPQPDIDIDDDDDESKADAPQQLADDEDLVEEWHLDAESTQLQPEEAFFLLFALGSLSLRTSSPDQPTGPELSILQAWRTFLLTATSSIPIPRSLPVSSTDPRLSRWDSPFLLSYVAYHHYRSLGWVARSGIKFCVDWVLYGPGGPVQSHAEFAVVVLPSYQDPKDARSSPFAGHGHDNEWMIAEGEKRNSWRWFHTVNRICSGVKKTLVLCYVLVPPMSTLPSPDWIARNPAQAIQRFQVREVTVRRWMAGRMRD